MQYEIQPTISDAWHSQMPVPTAGIWEGTMGYSEEIEKVRTELLEREDQYITFRDLVERFDEIEKEYPIKQWNLLQIYSNLNILIGEKKIDSPDKELKEHQEACREAFSATTDGRLEFAVAMEEAVKRGERI